MTLLVFRSNALNRCFELCMHIQNISNKADFIRSLKFKVKRLDITTQRHIGYIKYDLYNVDNVENWMILSPE